MLVYLAGPFFNETELKQNEDAEDILVSKQLEVFVPRKHIIPDGEIIEHWLWAKYVYQMDVDAIIRSDVMVLLYDGLYSDSGTAFECGYAKALNIPIIVVYLTEDISSLMITNAAFSNLIGLDALKEYDFTKMKRIHYYKEQK